MAPGRKFYAISTSVSLLFCSIFLIQAAGCHYICIGYPTFPSAKKKKSPPNALSLYGKYKKLGLREKAQGYEKNLQERHYTSDGLVAYKINLPIIKKEDVEVLNLADAAAWTGCYLAAEAFRYAITKDPDVLKKIEKTVEGLHKLQAVTGIKGLLARTFIRSDIPDPSILQHGEWHPGKAPFTNYFWRGDVSNDQYDGVMFGYGICYDLVPQKSIRKRIQQDVKDLMNHIIDHGMAIVDVDGKVTTHGDMSPHSWEDLDALLALSFLKISSHITSERKFEDKYRELISRHSYHRRADTARKKWWECFLGINHSDNNLSLLAYYNLMRLEEDKDLLSYYRKGLERAWETVGDEGNSLFNFIYLASTQPVEAAVSARQRMGTESYPHKPTQSLGPRSGVLAPPESMRADKKSLERNQAWQDALKTLQLFPSNKLVVEVINSRRKDIKKAWFSDRHGHPQGQQPLPIHQRPVNSFEWKANPYRLDGHEGARGEGEYAGVDYLLAYWLGRYHGFISADM